MCLKSILWVRDICDTFSTTEKSMITSEFTICKTSVELNIMLQAQDITNDINVIGCFLWNICMKILISKCFLFSTQTNLKCIKKNTFLQVLGIIISTKQTKTSSCNNWKKFIWCQKNIPNWRDKKKYFILCFFLSFFVCNGGKKLVPLHVLGKAEHFVWLYI